MALLQAMHDSGAQPHSGAGSAIAAALSPLALAAAYWVKSVTPASVELLRGLGERRKSQAEFERLIIQSINEMTARMDLIVRTYERFYARVTGDRETAEDYTDG